MRKQVVVIHGGDTFENYDEYLDFLREYELDIERYKTEKDDWKPWLRGSLGGSFEVILPVMPNKWNAQFQEWKMWFEKLIPFFNDEIILVGHSLGASFIAKYLSENKFPKRLLGVFLVSGVFDIDSQGYSLVSFALPKKLNLQTENIYLYHSKDDDVVPFSELEKFNQALPTAITRVFENRKHINQPEFQELSDDILNIFN